MTSYLGQTEAPLLPPVGFLHSLHIVPHTGNLSYTHTFLEREENKIKTAFGGGEHI